MRFSKNFQLTEFLELSVSDRAGHGLNPTESDINNMKRLACDVLQPIRDILNRPIYISSGYRDIWLNQKIGGSTGSAHTSGRAVDYSASGMTAKELMGCVCFMDGLPYDKVILEFNSWVHIQVPRPEHEPRRLKLEAACVRGFLKYREYSD